MGAGFPLVGDTLKVFVRDAGGFAGLILYTRRWRGAGEALPDSHRAQLVSRHLSLSLFEAQRLIL